MANGNILTGEERARVAEAIRQAEGRTSGEIYCVLARASDSYFFPAAFFVSLSILLFSLLASFFLHHWWISVRPGSLVMTQLAAIGAALLLLEVFPRLRIHFVPRRLRYRRAHDNALRQFLSRNIHATGGRTGALIFVSLAERYAEVVADAGIGARVPQERWNEAVAILIRHAAGSRLADGLVEAVQIVGTELSTHFPPGTVNPDELDNHVAEI
ncbi:TPM domain-containing protein [Chelativorans sp.]|uniref:TPM domain-containing protein n=1 Tax=Chelativorans sp. TaxID=2203393 RepID=UPI0028117210|nr:TPM domain-containing protein [Chelativorans sp.]